MKIINNLEGKIVVVPLRNGGYATGLIANQNKDVLLGYFFETYYHNPLSDIKEWHPAEVCLICLFGILGIEKKKWNILGNMPLWKKEEWTVPIFAQQDPINPEKYYSIIYQNDLKEYKKNSISKEDAQQYYNYGVYGYGAVEIVLTKKIKK